MERLVFQAAQEGNVVSLMGLLQEDPLILDRILAANFSETPLHVAAMLGHVDFVIEIVRRKPQFTIELNSNKSSPLHLASARGFIDVVKALISVDVEMIAAFDNDGRNPLHLAAMKGRVDVLQVLLQAKPDAARAIMHRGETILHMCVMHNQLVTMKLLIEIISDRDFLNAKNDDGNTILHMAVDEKQIETINYLLLNTGVEVNAINLFGLTAKDILIQSRRDAKDMDIGESLSRAGAVVAKDHYSPQNRIFQDSRTIEQRKSLEELSVQQQQKNDWLERKRNTLMIVASLIATMAFQAGMNPPGGLWQETKIVHFKDQIEPVEVQEGHSIWDDNDPLTYRIFLLFNTISFIASLNIILLLISGLPLRHRVFVWTLMVIIWVSIISIVVAYATSVAAIIDWNKEEYVSSVTGVVMDSILVILALLLFGHFIRIIVKIIKALLKFVRRKRMESNSRIAVVNNDYA